MMGNTKRYQPMKDLYGWYDKYNFFEVYPKHEPLQVKVCFLGLSVYDLSYSIGY